MKGGGARARLDGLESHCKWGNRIAPTQWTKIEALLAGLTVASREPDRSHPAMHPAFRCMPRGLRGSVPVATERDRTRSQIARQGPCAGQTRAHAQARHRPMHRPDTGRTQARHRPDTGQTQARHRPDTGPCTGPCTGQAQAPTQAASPVLLPVLNRPPHRPKTGLWPPSGLTYLRGGKTNWVARS